MTKKEFKQLIISANDPDWFNNAEILVSLPIIDFGETIKGITSLFDFYDTQIIGWEKYEILPPQLAESKNFFIDKKRKLIDVCKLLMTYTVQQRESYWNQNTRQFEVQRGENIFFYNCSEVIFLLSIFTNKKDYFIGAFNFFIGQSIDINDRNKYIGSLLAYEFYSKDFSDFTKRKSAERTSLQTLKNDFQNYISESSKQLTEHLSSNKKSYEKYIEDLDDLKNAKEEIFENWYTEKKDGFHQFEANSAQIIRDFEDLYRDKLMLEAPAEYWKTRAMELKKEGNRWICGLVLTTLIGVILLTVLLSYIANGKLEKLFENNGSAIRWSIAFITMISFIAFLIRTFTKLTFSTFHLVRDAEERRQLSFVYLALKENNAVSDIDRQIILQSIFSRADTGLLREDSSPTMPSSFIEKITKNSH